MGCEFTELYPVLLSLTISPGKKLSIESYYEHKYIRFKTNLLILFNEKKTYTKVWLIKKLFTIASTSNAESPIPCENGYSKRGETGYDYGRPDEKKTMT